MCGACGVAQQDWAAPVLASSYAKPLVARLLTGMTPALSVRATSVGWTVALAGRASTVHTSSADLLDHAARLLVARGVEPDSVAAMREAPAHREVLVTRDMFPASRTHIASQEAHPVPPTQLIPALLAAALTARMSSTSDPAEIVLGDSQGAWALRVS